MHLKHPERLARRVTVAAVIILFGFGLAMALFPIRPFWNDEWRLMYNIKFKDFQGLWGRLDLLQECPRMYLMVLKGIGSLFDYSYVSFRLPPLIIGLASVLLIFSLRRKWFPGDRVYSYLFVFILISSQTFTDYLVQVKHYEVDIFLCLVALWQLFVLLRIAREGIANRSRYFLLCISFLVAPFFSYTYPIVAAPVYVVLFTGLLWPPSWFGSDRRRQIIRLMFPLGLAVISIGVFFWIDVRNMMSNSAMYDSYLQVYYDGQERSLLYSFWYLFALVGSGLVFEIIFGVLGIVSFLYAILKLVQRGRRNFRSIDYLVLYGVLVLVVVLFLISTGKLIGGVARLTAYSVPSIAIIIVYFIKDLRRVYSFSHIANGMVILLFAGLLGNVITSSINNFTYPEYSRRIQTYWNTSAALKEARLQSIPFMVNYAVCGDPVYREDVSEPGQIQTNTITSEQIAGVDLLAAEVIVKVNSEYKIWDPVPYFYLPDTVWLREYVRQLPPEYDAAIAGDGLHFEKIEK